MSAAVSEVSHGDTDVSNDIAEEDLEEGEAEANDIADDERAAEEVASLATDVESSVAPVRPVDLTASARAFCKNLSMTHEADKRQGPNTKRESKITTETYRPELNKLKLVTSNMHS